MAMRLLCALFLSLSALAVPAHAQEWPNKPVRIIVPFGAGGLGDLLARMAGDHLSSAFKSTFVIENRTGAGGMLGAQQGAGADPDGYTLTLTNVSTLCLVPATNAQTPYNPLKDFTHIAYLGGAPASLAAFTGIGAKTVKEFISYANGAGKALTFGSTGFGSDGHLVGEAMGRALGISVQHVPYRGAPQAMSDLFAGHLAFLPFTIGVTGEAIKLGKLTGLAVSSPSRMPSLPDVPTFKELGYPDLVTLTWFSLSGPAKLPRGIAEALNREIVVMLKKPEVVAKLNQLGIVSQPMSTDEFTSFVAAEIALWRPMIEAADLLGKVQ
ncbi:MAG: tripartite tricarboxylate transporter substrate binding protein [Hyphomicrobiales bacterium]|nr:tripartite tricarboxylate transporter substrate binding protein [Hyphomicrobiales bacterium]